MRVASWTAVPILATLVLAAPTGAAGPRRTVQDRMVSLALREHNRHVREVPARSNTGPAIARYHTAVKHAWEHEAWCTIFVSYIARRAGWPLGRHGQGIWSVKNLYHWARRASFYHAKKHFWPRPGDIAVHGFGHTGIVVRVSATGTVWSVDGNWNDRVVYQLTPTLSLSGYIRLPSSRRTALVSR